MDTLRDAAPALESDRHVPRDRRRRKLIAALMRSIVPCKSAQGSRERSGRCEDSGSRMDQLKQSASRLWAALLDTINGRSRRANLAVVVTTNVAIPSANVRLQ